MSYSSIMSKSRAGLYKAQQQAAPKFRGVTNDKDPKMSMSYDGGGSFAKKLPGKKKKKSNGGQDDGYGDFASNFEMPYRINAQTLAGYEGRETASAANLAKLQQGYADRYDRNMGYLDDAQANELLRVNEAIDRQRADANQDLVSRGLRGSTVAETTGLGYERARQQAIGDVNESVRRERLATDAQLSGDGLMFGERGNATANDLAGERLRFMASTKSDYPNWQDGAAYAQQLASATAQGGAPGGGYGGGVNGQGGSYLAGLAYQPLGNYGYNVPNLTGMGPLNLNGAGGNYSASSAALANRASRGDAANSPRSSTTPVTEKLNAAVSNVGKGVKAATGALSSGVSYLGSLGAKAKSYADYGLVKPKMPLSYYNSRSF